MEEIGSGTFGQVRNVNGEAVKTFKKLKHMLQEVAVVCYMKRSPYVVNCIDYDLERLEMTMPLYQDTLRGAMTRYNFSEQKLHTIFSSIILGVRDIHARDILHSDLKPSNILVNYDPLEVVICDLGLSAVTKYAKTKQTARGYRLPDELLDKKNRSVHDHFSLSIIGLELFTGIRLASPVLPKDVRAAINDNIQNKILRKSLIGLTCLDIDNPRYMNVDMVAKELYGDFHPTKNPLITEVPRVISEKDVYDYGKLIKRLTIDYNIRRGPIIHATLMNRLNDRNYKVIPRSQYNLYVVALLLLFSSIFCHGGYRFDEVDAIELLKRHGTWDMDDLYDALYDILDKENVMRHVLYMSMDSKV